MSSLYFPKPQPLSPSPKRRSYMGKDGRYYQLKKGKEVLVKGVEQTESIYYGKENRRLLIWSLLNVDAWMKDVDL